MTLPSFIFGSFFAFLIGSIFHLLFGGDFKRLLLYVFISWLGFWVGDFISREIGLRFISVGLLNLGFSIIGSLIFLFIAYWLGMENPETNNKNQ